MYFDTRTLADTFIREKQHEMLDEGIPDNQVLVCGAGEIACESVRD